MAHPASVTNLADHRRPLDTAVTKPVAGPRPTPSQREWLARGLAQPGGKLPLFDANGRRVNVVTVRRCVEMGWAEPWFNNPIKPDWEVCKLTDLGRRIAGA
ncbi:MAG: hypothetical protein AB7G15_19910 [Alphaproteobacteria bacterium]